MHVLISYLRAPESTGGCLSGCPNTGVYIQYGQAAWSSRGRDKEGERSFGNAQTAQSRTDTSTIFATARFVVVRRQPARRRRRSRISSLSDEGNQSILCDFHRLLGLICRSRGKTEQTITHFETALSTASPSNRRGHLSWNSYSLAQLFPGENRFDDAHVHIDRVKSHAAGDPYRLLVGRAMELQAEFWYKNHRLGEAKFEI